MLKNIEKLWKLKKLVCILCNLVSALEYIYRKFKQISVVENCYWSAFYQVKYVYQIITCKLI